MEGLLGRLIFRKSNVQKLEKYSKTQLIYGILLLLFGISIAGVVFLSETKILSVQTIKIALVCFIMAYFAVKRGYNKQMKKYRNDMEEIAKKIPKLEKMVVKSKKKKKNINQKKR